MGLKKTVARRAQLSMEHSRKPVNPSLPEKRDVYTIDHHVRGIPRILGIACSLRFFGRLQFRGFP